ncbi:hypothetical protein F5Y16DRAFT_381495 [Xylariaceae sp. FL0255]|nr:hypothetical protein F5Y16DRAFT_381495 [Xylariaceae sp. FL0255]
MSSSEHRPTTLAQESPFYTTTRAMPNTSQGYYANNLSIGSTADVLSSLQSQPRTFYRTSGTDQVYSTNGYSSTEGAHGSSSNASFIGSRSGSYDSAFPQAVTPESGLGGNQVDAYGYMYSASHNQSGTAAGIAGITPPTLSPTSGSQQHRRKSKASSSSSSSSRQRRSSKHSHHAHSHRGFSPPESIIASSSTTGVAIMGGGGMMARGGNRSKLRSASRTSKNTHHNPPATAEERKSRETHNNVEKQYRNRLNAHFESLLSALPESMQSGGGDDENDEGMGGAGGGVVDSTDRRVSKAEVLDMARRHIKALERECLLLESERDELRENMEKLRWLFGRCEGGGAAAAAAAGIVINGSGSTGAGASVSEGVGFADATSMS